MFPNTAHFRFYEELNDFLPSDKRKHTFTYSFNGNPSVKDAIEAIGVPHPEVDLVLVNGSSVAFNYQLHDGDHVSVYPVFESIDITPIVHLRPEPLRDSKFILDVHLGKLAKLLRMLGFDTLYRNDYEDAEIVAVAAREQRIILTCDRGLLKHGTVTHGYCVRSRDTNEQLQEIIDRFDLSRRFKPFHRCSACNGLVTSVDKEDIRTRLEPNTLEYYDRFFICSSCGKIYWEGSHFTSLLHKLHTIIQNNSK